MSRQDEVAAEVRENFQYLSDAGRESMVEAILYCEKMGKQLVIRDTAAFMFLDQRYKQLRDRCRALELETTQLTEELDRLAERLGGVRVELQVGDEREGVLFHE